MTVKRVWTKKVQYKRLEFWKETCKTDCYKKSWKYLPGNLEELLSLCVLPCAVFVGHVSCNFLPFCHVCRFFWTILYTCMHICLYTYLRFSLTSTPRNILGTGIKEPSICPIFVSGCSSLSRHAGKRERKKEGKTRQCDVCGGGSANHLFSDPILCREKPRTLSSWYFWFRCSWVAPNS